MEGYDNNPGEKLLWLRQEFQCTVGEKWSDFVCISKEELTASANDWIENVKERSEG